MHSTALHIPASIAAAARQIIPAGLAPPISTTFSIRGLMPSTSASAGRIDHARIRERHPDQKTVDVFLFESGVGDRLGRQAATSA